MKYNKDFYKIIKDIINNETFKNLKIYKHHYIYTRFEHSLSVSYYSYLVCKFLKLDYTSAARAGLLHDLFFYDCEDKFTRPKNHIKMHPKIALNNAKQLFFLNDKEQDIILKHMWPLTFSLPKYLESFIITFVDKYCAFKEWCCFCAYYIANNRNQTCIFVQIQFLLLFKINYLLYHPN